MSKVIAFRAKPGRKFLAVAVMQVDTVVGGDAIKQAIESALKGVGADVVDLQVDLTDAEVELPQQIALEQVEPCAGGFPRPHFPAVGTW